MGRTMDFRPSSPHPKLLRKRSHVSQQSFDVVDDCFPAARSCRSLPGLRLPLSHSKSFIDGATRSHTDHHERPSSAGSRRSVSGMKSLLPLKLQSTPPMPSLDVSAWIDNTIRQTRSSNTLDVLPRHQEISIEERVSWTGSRHHGTFTDISQPRYRETAVYSEPASPSFSPAYATDEELRTISRASDAASGDKLATFYTSSLSESVLSCDDCALSDYAAPDDPDETSHTSGTVRDSFMSPRGSGLSIKCQGEYAMEAAWLKPTRRLASGFEESYKSPALHSASESWIESDSSRCSSSLGSDDVYDALATHLAPATAHVVDLSSERAMFSPRLISLPSPVVCHSTPVPGGASRMTTFDRPFSPERSIRGSPHTTKTCLSPITTTAKPQPWGLQTPPMTPPLSTTPYHYQPMSMSMPKPSLASPNSSTSFAARIQDHQGHAPWSIENAAAELRILSGLSTAISGFPSEMLFLDTPCIVDIRRANQQSLHSHAAPQSLHSTSSSLSMSTSETQDDTGAPLRRRTKVPRLSYTAPRPQPQDPHTHHPAISPPPPAPDLTSLRAIFPSTDDWWRRVLYAHLLAHNYVCDLERAVPQREQACAEVREGLLRCIGRVVECMAGHGGDVHGARGGAWMRGAEGTLVRALAEVVRVGEA